MTKLRALIFTLLVLNVTSVYSQTKKTPSMKNVTEFKVQVSQQVLNDLKSRLQNTRWPGEAEGSGWNFGTSETYLRGLVRYWLNEYDWRKQESLLNGRCSNDKLQKERPPTNGSMENESRTLLSIQRQNIFT